MLDLFSKSVLSCDVDVGGNGVFCLVHRLFRSVGIAL